MAVKRAAKQPPPVVDPKLKPVRVDLPAPVHKALRRAAAEADMSMAALARRIISQEMGFPDEGGK